MSEKSYLELFPKESLVYLTADANNDITDLDPNLVPNLLSSKDR